MVRGLENFFPPDYSSLPTNYPRVIRWFFRLRIFYLLKFTPARFMLLVEQHEPVPVRAKRHAGFREQLSGEPGDEAK
jgi:hypothetical protein